MAIIDHGRVSGAIKKDAIDTDTDRVGVAKTYYALYDDGSLSPPSDIECKFARNPLF